MSLFFASLQFSKIMPLFHLYLFDTQKFFQKTCLFEKKVVPLYAFLKKRRFLASLRKQQE